ncbi:hypothetical protein [Vulcanisaeta distributa]|uniref:Uncharacterized protein n=1 Tax=Vulcanisaeta distributa (strain DSM 14429 / JCM 11212 / NBRC 100878 / IC-017) TaxID=572478 RepID=E1QTE3_VULDI|nr:hypothetical protein [Vulcanisaeta distributa]ADN50936.1 hypothetical protein Vdis_1554 [Vulcanisaeta distributa DSM 14429]
MVISGLVKREFLLKLVDRAVESVVITVPINQTLEDYVDYLTDGVISSLKIKVINTDNKILDIVYQLYGIVKQLVKDVKKKVLRALDRDAINAVHASMINATFITKDHSFVDALKKLSNNVNCNESVMPDLRIMNCSLTIMLGTTQLKI